MTFHIKAVDPSEFKSRVICRAVALALLSLTGMVHASDKVSCDTDSTGKLICAVPDKDVLLLILLMIFCLLLKR